jgi:hypothetical protein
MFLNSLLEVFYVYGKTDLFYKSVFSSFQSPGYRLIFYVFSLSVTAGLPLTALRQSFHALLPAAAAAGGQYG